MSMLFSKRKLVRGLGPNFRNIFGYFGAKTFLMLSYCRFGQGARYGKCAFSYCCVDFVPPKPLKIGDFGPGTEYFEYGNRECTSSILKVLDF